MSNVISKIKLPVIEGQEEKVYDIVDRGAVRITSQELTSDERNQVLANLKIDDYASTEYVENLYKNLFSDKVLRFYCIEDVTIILNGVSTTYAANSNVEVKFLDTDVWEIVPTSDNSILALNGFPGALGTYYSWLEGVKQFSNILFDMNNVDFYSKWSQGNQGVYQVQFAQYINCIFWSDNPYVSDVNKRTNYTLYYTSQLPLCYSSIPDNTFKAFFLAFGVNSDPNWGNKAYRDSFAKATWATQAFSYYGARTVGIFGHDDPDFNITLPKDCRGLMYDAAGIENAGTFDAINVTNFGAKSGSWRDAFGRCYNLKNLYIKNLKVNLNLSWSPINYEAISFIISTAANTNAITISLSPYTYNLLSESDFELATSKNITIELITTNYIEDRRLNTIANKADKATTDSLQEAINVLNGTGEGSIKYAVADAVATIVAQAPEDFDTLKEIADWIANDETGTINLVERVANIEENIEELSNTILQEKDPTVPDWAKAATKPTYTATEITGLIDLIYPVGSIYTSINSTSPSTLFGGTWEQIKGRFLIGTGTPVANTDGSSPGSYNYAAGNMGGEAEHTLTIEEMPSHRHNIRYDGTGVGYSSNGTFALSKNNTDDMSPAADYTGGDQPHNNIPPYLAVYIWKRTA